MRHDSLFTRQMSNRFRHRLEDYRVASLSKASLCSLDDHLHMCKIAGRGAMYKMIKGNIQQFVNQAIFSMEGCVPLPTIHPVPLLQTPPRQFPTLYSPNSSPYPSQKLHPHSTSPYTSQQLQGSTRPTDNITGTMYLKMGQIQDQFSWPSTRIRDAGTKPKNLEYQIFEEHRSFSAKKTSRLWLLSTSSQYPICNFVTWMTQPSGQTGFPKWSAYSRP